MEGRRGGNGRIHSRSLRSGARFAEPLSCAMARLSCNVHVVCLYALHVVQSVLQY